MIHKMKKIPEICTYTCMYLISYIFVSIYERLDVQKDILFCKHTVCMYTKAIRQLGCEEFLVCILLCFDNDYRKLEVIHVPTIIYLFLSLKV